MKKTRLAFYLGKRSENKDSKIGDWLICWVTNKRFSHVEMIRSIRIARVGTIVDKKPFTGAIATMLSSSLRDNGVRQKDIAIYTNKWVIVEYDRDPTMAIKYIEGRFGKKYGLFDLLSFLLPFRVSNSNADFCSELIADASMINGSWHIDPGEMYEWAEKQPGFRILSNEEILKEWSALNE